MKWQWVNGIYRVTISGLMSWKFKSLHDGIEWAYITKESRNLADEMDNLNEYESGNKH